MTYNPVNTHVDYLWRTAMRHVLSAGDVIAPRGQHCREVRGATLELLYPDHNLLISRKRHLNYHFGVAEWLWMLHGLNDVKTISAYNSKIGAYSDDGETFYGAYGPSLVRDLPRVVELLLRDPDSRQAIVQTWKTDALSYKTKDVPCTVTWHFMLRKRELELQVFMRSNDLWLGFPYDVFNFTQIQRWVAAQLNVAPGRYRHTVGSLHIYERDIPAIEDLLRHVLHYDFPDHLMRMKLPEPTPVIPEALGKLLTGLPQDGMALPVARNLRLQIGEAWQEYAGVLIHRFSKNDLDLGPIYHRLICER